MSEAAPHSPLPRVEKTDLHLVAIEELLDPDHVERWAEFARDNPLFAREILLEAHRLGEKGETLEQIAINIATFTTQALRVALERKASGGGEDSPLSDEQPLDS